MRSIKVILAAVFSVLSICVYAQGEKKSENGSMPKLNVRVGLGGVASVPYFGGANSGFAANVGGYVELPMSKRYDGWKVNLGMRLSNRNLSTFKAHIYGLNTPGVSHSWHYDARELFIEVPVIFSYDFHVSEKSDFRLNFGLFYSRYVTGDVMLRETGETFLADEMIYSQVNPEYNHAAFVMTHDNVGAILGLGYYFKDFYFGTEYEMMYMALDGENFACGLYASIGYRF